MLLGYFEGDGNFTHFFSNPFAFAQVDLHTRLAGREGNYRAYVWTRDTTHCQSIADPSQFLTCSQLADGDRVRLKGRNSGVGLSLDQAVTDKIGLWARYGYEDPDVSQFANAASAGVAITGPIAARPQDTLGLAYGFQFPGSAYKHATGFNDVQHYGEVYYRITAIGDDAGPNLALSPDLQVVANPQGNRAIDPVPVYGLRAQASF